MVMATKREPAQKYSARDMRTMVRICRIARTLGFGVKVDAKFGTIEIYRGKEDGTTEICTPDEAVGYLKGVEFERWRAAGRPDVMTDAQERCE